MGDILKRPRQLLDGYILLGYRVICRTDNALSSRTYGFEISIPPEDGKASVAHLHRVKKAGVAGCRHLGTWPGAQERHRSTVRKAAPSLSNLCHSSQFDLHHDGLHGNSLETRPQQPPPLLLRFFANYFFFSLFTLCREVEWYGPRSNNH